MKEPMRWDIIFYELLLGKWGFTQLWSSTFVPSLSALALVRRKDATCLRMRRGSATSFSVDQ
jgi:hypothetical protein